MTRPNALIVGVNKAGTTALFNALSQHPSVIVSDKKETHFFDPLKYGEPLGSLAAYDALFPNAPSDSVVLEATPGYFYGGVRVAEAIDATAKDSRVIIVLREPGSRAYSWWKFCRTRLLLPQELGFDEYLDTCEALELDPERQREAVAWRGLSGGDYARFLPEWLNVFGTRLLVIYHDDLRAHPQRTLDAVCAHLQISPLEHVPSEDNVSVDVRNGSLQRIALRVNDAAESLWRRFPTLKKRLRAMYYVVGARRTQDRMTPAQRRRLNAHFAPSLRQLRTILPDVPANWGETE